jgi:hypothetical protein
MRKLVYFLLAVLQFQNLFSQEHGLGAIPLSVPEYRKLPKLRRISVRTRVPPPLSFLLETPPVGDQGSMGSCVGWAVGYTFFSSFIRRQISLPDPPNPRPWPIMVWNEESEMSPSYLFNQIRVNPMNCQEGSSTVQGLELMRAQGNSSVKSMPYRVGDCNTQPGADQRLEASKFISTLPRTWYAANPKDYELFLNSLVKYRRPIVVVLPVYKAFDDMWNYKKGKWTDNPTIGFRGYHAVCIIGYDRKNKLFKCQNQWGVVGGDEGYFWVTFDLVNKGCFIEAYIWTGSNPNPTPVPFPKPIPGLKS